MNTLSAADQLVEQLADMWEIRCLAPASTYPSALGSGIGRRGGLLCASSSGMCDECERPRLSRIIATLHANGYLLYTIRITTDFS